VQKPEQVLPPAGESRRSQEQGDQCETKSGNGRELSDNDHAVRPSSALPGGAAEEPDSLASNQLLVQRLRFVLAL
jgi:hypothetical protein